MRSRALKFAIVGAAGFVLQLVVLTILTSVFHVRCLPATLAAIECAVVHNFWWHARWTWSDRVRAGWLTKFARFHAGTLLTSIGGSLAVMTLLITMVDMPVVLANAIAVAVVSGANFMLGDRWIFRHAASVAVVAVTVLPVAASAQPADRTVREWTGYVARTEAAFDRLRGPRVAPGEVKVGGGMTAIDGGTITDWQGTVFIPGITVDRLLDRLQHPGTPPPQEDVVASRVLARGADSLRVYVRLVRRAIVTVTYDTEHTMAFHRVSSTLATARSSADRIDQVGGGDAGFLWRMNSYWRYEQRPGGVLVTVQSLTLSRDVPALLGPVAERIVQRIARESMTRTLLALRGYE